MKVIRTFFTQLKSIKRCIAFFMTYAWKKQPIYFFYVVSSIIVQSLGPFITIIGTKYLINEIAYESNRDIKKVTFWIIFICLGAFIYKVLTKITNEKQFTIGDGFRTLLETELSMRAIKMKFQYTENSDMLDKIKNAERGLDETGQIQGITNGIIGIISNIFVLSGVIYLVVSASPVLLVPIVLSFIVSSFANMRTNNQREKYFSDVETLERGFSYYDEEMADSRYAKDVRLYDAGNMVLENQLGLGCQIYNAALRNWRKVWHNERFEKIVSNCCNSMIYIILGIKVLQKTINLGDFSSLIQATKQFTDSITGIVSGYFGIEYTASILKYYIDFIETIDKYEENEIDSSIPFDIDLSQITIEFRNVSFRYPGTELYVLKNVNTTIHHGEHLSIVGFNGAGKTTFIKLLCRLYDVTEGEILINGRNINLFAFQDYVKILSVVFQDYRLLAFSIRDNITLGDNDVSDEQLFKLCELGGISEWIKSTDKKMDTIMYKMFDESGIEPSGGQAQKLAIVRALYKDSPIVILDEPTAALDPISEYEIYKHFDSLVGGKTAVYISHRLSSCRFCDRIIVFHNGTIIEDGTHDELMTIQNGFYANMYNTQAKHYK